MARYEPNKANVGRWLASDGDLRAALRDRADAIADRARVLAPIRSGRYKASIDVRPSAWTDRRGQARMAYDVTADVPYGAVVEVGRRNIVNRGHHTLRRAAETLST